MRRDLRPRCPIEAAPEAGLSWDLFLIAEQGSQITTHLFLRGVSARLKPGEIALMPAEIPHLARNDGSGGARALVTHSRSDKEKPFVVVVKRAT
jgi:hypothetical protein